MAYFTRLFLICTLGALVVTPIAVNRYGWGYGSERDAKVIAAARVTCAPEFRDANGACISTARAVHARRSFFGDGSYGHGK